VPTSYRSARCLAIVVLALIAYVPVVTPVGAADPSIARWSRARFLESFEQTVAPAESGTFVPLSDDTVAETFSSLVEDLMRGDIGSAEQQRRNLEAAGVAYRLVRITDAGGSVLGFVENAEPGDKHYRGWGAALVRPDEPGCDRVYGAPHVQSDRYSEDIALLAFAEDSHACALLLAGAQRDADSGKISGEDAANSTHNLFHTLTAWFARSGLKNGYPLWFVQIHGSDDRSGQPGIVGSNGTRVALPAGSPLPQIADAVNADGHVTMGVCGREADQPIGDVGNYHLCATGNAQMDVLASLGLPESFLHFELERHIRDEFHQGGAKGEAAVDDLLSTLREVLNESGPPSLLAPVVSPTAG
jgi:hypothetical protein